MQFDTIQKSEKLDFRHLPAFAEFLQTNHLEAFVREQLRVSGEVKLPILATLLKSMSEKELIQLSVITTSEFLHYLANNNAQEQIDTSQQKYLSDQLPALSRDQISAEDITLIPYIRKQAFMHFIPAFTDNLTKGLALLKEIDLFLLESENSSAEIYIRLLKNKINEELYFKEKITNTTPGIVYVYDLLDQKSIFSNKKIGQYLGYSEPELSAFDDLFFTKLIHADDLTKSRNHYLELEKLGDKDIKTFEYRLKASNGLYKWYRTYESVFRRKNDGKVWQVIGIAIDIQNEKQTEQQLFYREAQLLEAQELSELGSFEWDLISGESQITPQIEKIFELKNHQPLDSFLEQVHPDDRSRVEGALKTAMEDTGVYDCEFRYLADGKEKVVWSRGIVTFDENGKPLSMRGTVLNTSERHSIIQRLRVSEDLYKQAQATTHIGNYMLDLETDELTWSDELYRIYGLNPGDPLSREHIANFNHPLDADFVLAQITDSVTQNKSFDFHYRIILKDNTVKILHALGEVLTEGNKRKLYGTAQDVTERQHLIERLQQSDELYKQAQAISHIGNWSYEIKTDTTYWTDEMYRIFGLKPQSKGLTYEEFLHHVHPEDRQSVKAFAEQAVKAKIPYQMYHRNIWDDGTVKILHIRGDVVTNENGKAIRLFGTAQDVTEQQRTEQQLRENQNFIQKIADATPSIIASYNINSGKYRFVSRGIEKLLGYDAETAIREGVEFFIRIIHPDDLGPMMEKNAQALQSANVSESNMKDVIVDWIYRMRHKNGEYRWFHTFGTIFDRNQEGNVEHVLNISIDITDKIEAEKKVLEQELFIKHIADASPTVLYLFDSVNGKVIYANKEIESVLGYTPEEMLQMGSLVIEKLYHPEDASRIPERLHEYNDPLHPQSLFQFETRMRHRNGEWRWLLIREIVFKRNEEGKILEVLGAALDISHRKEMEETLQQKTLELEQSNASLEEFAYVASHDLKEPLRKISTFGDRLLTFQKDKLDKDGKSYLEKIIHSSHRMQQMINDLLSVSLISGEKSFRKVSLKALLDDAIQALEYKIEERNPLLEISTLPDATVIPSQFRQLFQNLLSNSLKFVKPDERPKITISYRYLLPGQLTVTNLGKSNQYLEITFADNGIGFDKSFAEKIFAIFQRLHNKSDYEGTGIGLAICKKIAENHGGTILASGEPEVGAKFIIILPI